MKEIKPVKTALNKIILKFKQKEKQFMKTIKLAFLIFIFLISGFLSSSTAQWVNHSSGMGTAIVECLASDGNDLYAGTYGAGIFKSTNNGVNWSNIGLYGNVVHSIVISGGKIIAGTSSNAWYSTDGGTTWDYAFFAPGNDVFALIIKGNKIFAGTPDGIYVSSDNGTNWTQGGLNSPPVSVMSFTANDNTIFAGTGSYGVYKSTDNGVVWSHCLNANLTIVSMTTIGSNIFAGASHVNNPPSNGLFLSTDNGSSWSPDLFAGNTPVYALLTDGTDIYAGLGNQIFLSTNTGTNWMNVTDDLPTNGVYSLTKFNNYLFAGLYGNGVWRRPAFTQFNITAIPEGFYNSSTNELNMADTLRAYLRNAAAPYDIADSAQTVIDPVSFTGLFTFTRAHSGNYYIVLKHRNSIETWSKAGGETMLQGLIYSYDFTTSSSQAFGNNMVLKGNRYCIYSGDVNQDGTIDGADNLMVKNDADNFVSGYVNTDVTGNDFTNLNDLLITYNNSVKFVSAKTPMIVQGSSMQVQDKTKQDSENSSFNEYELSDNYPNPFNPTTQISYQIPVEGNVILKIYDIAGKEVASLVNQRLSAGKYSATFNAGNLSSGTYFYKLYSEGFSQVKKMTLVK